MIPFTRRLAALSLMLLPVLSFAQDEDTDYSPQGHLERKAKRIMKKDGVTIKTSTDGKESAIKGKFDDLHAAEEKIVIQTIANKLRKIRKHNLQSFFKKRGSKQSFSDADVTIYLTDEDLDGLYAKYKSSMGTVISSTQTETPQPPLHTEEPPQILPIESHSDPAYHSLFADNAWVIQDKTIVNDDYPDGVNPAQELRDQIDDFLKDLGPNGRITGLTLHSSASTLNNTGEAADLTWLQLSEYRYRATLKFILVYLKSKGVTLDPSMTDDPKDGEDLPWAGENGDGTSGPQAPVVNGVQIGGKGNGQPAYVKGPGDTYQDLYSDHRYVDVLFTGILYSNGTGEPVVRDEPQDSEWSSRVVDLDIDTKSKRWWKYKKKTKIHIGHKHPKRKLFKLKKGKHAPVRCPGEAKTKFGRLLQKIFGQRKTGF